LTDDNKTERDREAHNVDVLAEQNEALQVRVNELTALTYQVVNHFENEFFNNQTMLRAIRDRLAMTPEVWAIVNKSKEKQQDSVNS